MPKKTTGSSKKAGQKLIEEYLATIRPWEDEAEIRQGRLPDRRPWYAQHVKSDGIPCWEALYFYTDAKLAVELFDLDSMGFGDVGRRDPEWPEKDLLEFDNGHFRWKERLRRLKADLLWRLRDGDLIARGFNSAAPLDAGRQAIGKARWKDFDLDLRSSVAKGANVVVTQILIFEAKVEQLKPARTSVRVPDEVLRKWYLKFIAACERKGVIPDRDEEYADAKQEFGERVARAPLRSLRKELAPEAWTRRGRRRGAPNRKGL